MSTVYLAGPITGLNYKGCTDWRQSAADELNKVGIKALSPMRAKSYLERLDKISGHGRDYAHMGPMSTSQGVVTRDRFDTQKSCSVVLMNLLGAERVSIGTMVELGWADSARVPVVLAMEETGNVHDHMFVRQLAGYVVGTLEEALAVVQAILL